MGGYRKLALVAEHVESTMEVDAVELLLEVLEEFAQGDGKKWLKIPGGEKGQVLDMLVKSSRLPSYCSQLSLGAFVGYRTARFAAAVPSRRLPGRCPTIVALEADPVHTIVARHLL